MILLKGELIAVYTPGFFLQADIFAQHLSERVAVIFFEWKTAPYSRLPPLTR